MLKDNSLVIASGGNEIQTETELVRAFIKRNKKVFTRNITIFNSEPKQYLEIIPCTDMKGKTVSEVFDLNKKLLIWFRDKYTFKVGEERLKEQIMEILKK